MKAIGIRDALPTDADDCFIEVDIDRPHPGPHDLLVEVKAISVNPVDTKVRSRMEASETPKILGYDAAGTVKAVGKAVTLFQPGDDVWYAGDITRPGSNAEYQLVDERIAGRKPAKVGFNDAAALPLTGITAYEALFERMGIPDENPEASRGKKLLIINGAGGVGSAAIQLAKKITELEVIATASREESAGWCRELGADDVLNHHELLNAYHSIRYQQFDYILCCADTDAYMECMLDLVAPLGHICALVDTHQSYDLNSLKAKSASFSFEFMFAKAIHKAPTLQSQNGILNRISELMDKGEIISTARELLKGLTTENLRLAHQKLESGKMLGKLVIEVVAQAE